MRKKRLELSRVAPLDPKSSASTNSATFANEGTGAPSPAGNYNGNFAYMQNFLHEPTDEIIRLRSRTAQYYCAARRQELSAANAAADSLSGKNQEVVGPRGLEPRTKRLRVSCSTN